MNSAERIAAAILLQEPDRVPVSPFMIYHLAAVTDTPMHEFVWDVETCHRASLKAFQFYDELPDTLNLAPMRFAFACTAPILFSSLYYDWRFPEDTVPQIMESVQDGPEVYEHVVRNGFRILRTHRRVGRWEVVKTMSIHLYQHLRWMKYWRKKSTWSPGRRRSAICRPSCCCFGAARKVSST